MKTYLRTNNQRTNKLRLNQYVGYCLKSWGAIIFALLISFASFAQTYDMYVSDAGNFNNGPWQILKFDQNGDNGEVFIPNSFFTDNNVGWPQDILFLESQNVVLISCLNGGRVTRHNAETGAYIDDFASIPGGPTRMKIGADGLIYIVQWNGTLPVLTFEQDGTPTGAFTNAGVNSSVGLDWNADGHLFVGSYGGSLIREFDENGMDQGVYINSNLSGPTNLEHLPNGDLLVLNWNNGTMSRFDANGVFQETISGLSQPEGIDFFPNGNMLIGNGGNGSVRLYDAGLAYVEDVVASGTLGLLQPNAVILKESTPTGIHDPVVEKAFLQSATGTTFKLQSQYIDQVESILVFNMNGQVINSSNENGEVAWDAVNAASGLYMVMLSLKNDEVYTQKVFVQ